MDKETRDLANLDKQVQEGSFPEQENEIAGQKNMFERLGCPNVKVGDKVHIRFRRNTHETYREKEFVVSGIMRQTAKEQENQSYTAYVSQDFFDSLYTPEETCVHDLFQPVGFCGCKFLHTGNDHQRSGRNNAE